MKKNKLILIFILFSVIGCSDETEVSQSEYRVEIVEILASGKNLATASYDQEKNNFIIAYWDYDTNQGDFEIRDQNYNIIKTGTFGGTRYSSKPRSITMIKDSVFVGSGSGSNYYKTSEGLLITHWSGPNYNSGSVTIVDPTIVGGTPFYYDFEEKLNAFMDTEDYIIISAEYSICFFIRKSNFEVISFKDSFEENNTVGIGGKGLGRDELGRIILSTHKGVKVFDNNQWLPFSFGELDINKRYWQFYSDSEDDKFYASTGSDVYVYDLISKKELLSFFKNFSFSRILGKHPDGTLIYLVSENDLTKRILKAKIIKN